MGDKLLCCLAILNNKAAPTALYIPKRWNLSFPERMFIDKNIADWEYPLLFCNQQCINDISPYCSWSVNEYVSVYWLVVHTTSLNRSIVSTNSLSTIPTNDSDSVTTILRSASP